MNRTWKWTVLACAGLASAICLLNVALTIWASQNDSTDEGSNVVRVGDCGNVSRSNTLIHVGINLLSILLLASSSFCMQLAIAPSRSEIDRAHARHRWLDIGIPSIRNLAHVPMSRRVCWILLALSSVPLHLVYNSTVFATTVATEYIVAEMDASYLETGMRTRLSNITYESAGGNLRSTDAMSDVFATFDEILANSSSWTNLTAEECAKEYSSVLLTSHRTLVLVVEPSPSHSQLPGLWRIVGTPTWMCDVPGNIIAPDRVDANGVPGFSCDPPRAEFGERKDGSYNWKKPGRTMYCLAEPFVQSCTLEISQELMIATIVANSIKAATMAYLFLILTNGPLTNLGDAISSFLRYSDPFTRGLSAQDAVDIKARWNTPEARRTTVETKAPTPVLWDHRCHRRQDAVSRRRLCISYSLFVVALAVVGVLFGATFEADKDRGVLHKTFSPGGILRKDIFAIIGFETLAGASLSGIVLLVNTPQLLQSMLYFLYNSLCSSFMEAQEWNDFASSYKPLRTTRFGSKQRSSFWLSLPPLYVIVLLVVTGTLHWLTSQAIFMAKIRFLNFAGGPSERFGGIGYGSEGGEHPGEMLTASYSTGAILLCLVFSCFMVGGLILVGLRRLKHQMTMVGSCSAAIAAACHTNGDYEHTAYDGTCDDDVTDSSTPIWESPMRWGDIGSDVGRIGEQKAAGTGPAETPRRLGFSSSNVAAPVEGTRYW